jgi:hypothetical protein
MPTAFGSFDKLTEGFAAAAVDPTRWDAAMDIASKETGSLRAMLFPVRGRTPNLPKSDSMRGLAEDYLGGGWVHRDERYRSAPALLRRGVLRNLISSRRKRFRKVHIIRTFSRATA